MKEKIINYVLWVIMIMVILIIMWFIIEPIIHWSQYSEIHLYMRLFLVMFAINTFAVLRLYNSIVQNTRFSIKLRESFTKFVGVVPGLERAMKNLNSTLGSVRSSSDSLKKELSDNTDKIEQFTEKINKFNKN